MNIQMDELFRLPYKSLQFSKPDLRVPLSLSIVSDLVCALQRVGKLLLRIVLFSTRFQWKLKLINEKKFTYF
jgi:hypothetical protein